MNDRFEFDEEEELEKQKKLLSDAFGKLDRASMKALEEWFRGEFGIHQAAFRVFNGEWNPLDAMRQDAFRLVWNSMVVSWKKVHEPGNTEEVSYFND